LIDINKITTSAIDENLRRFIDVDTNAPSKNDFETEARIYKALMDFSRLLLKNYHEALKAELAKYDINI